MNNPRKQIRLRNFDYSSEASYFITLNIKNRLQILSEIVDETIILSEIGKIADECMQAIPDHFPNAELDEYCIMPDHIHCIIFLIKDADGFNVGSRHFIPPLIFNQRPSESNPNSNSKFSPKANPPLIISTDITRAVLPSGSPDISLDAFSSGNNNIPPNSTRQPAAPSEQFNKFGRPIKGSISVIIQQFKSSVTRESNKKGLGKIIWHGRFHDHVIRSEAEYLRIKNYIRNNPSNWKKGPGRRL